MRLILAMALLVGVLQADAFALSNYCVVQGYVTARGFPISCRTYRPTPGGTPCWCFVPGGRQVRGVIVDKG